MEPTPGPLRDLTHAEERMRSVVNHVVDGIISIDERGTVTTFNPAAERIFGYEALEIIGQNVKVLMPEPYHGEHDGYIANYLRTGEAKIIRRPLRAPGGPHVPAGCRAARHRPAWSQRL